jgi:hypothetical protein
MGMSRTQAVMQIAMMRMKLAAMLVTVRCVTVGCVTVRCVAVNGAIGMSVLMRVVVSMSVFVPVFMPLDSGFTFATTANGTHTFSPEIPGARRTLKSSTIQLNYSTIRPTNP